MLTEIESEAIQKSLIIAKDYAGAILLDPLRQLGGILSDTVGYWRLKNQVRLLLKAKTWLESKGVQPGKILPDIFVPILENGSSIENETLSDMFASLLAAHLDSEKRESVHPSFSKILSELSPTDAQVLVEFRRLASYSQAREVGLLGAPMTVKMISKQVNIPRQQAYLSCLNLERLGLLTFLGTRPPSEHALPGIFENSRDHMDYRMSEYGIAFYDACHYGKPNNADGVV